MFFWVSAGGEDQPLLPLPASIAPECNSCVKYMAFQANPLCGVYCGVGSDDSVLLPPWVGAQLSTPSSEVAFWGASGLGLAVWSS